MKKTKEQKEDLEDTIEELNAKIDKITSDIARLKDEVKTLQQELAALAKAQAEMDALRAKEHDEYVSNKKELEEAIQGLQMALKVLRDYYAQEGKAHDAAEGTASSIMGLLEVVESDFSKNLAEMTVAETTAESQYEQETQANEIQKTIKQQEVKYKTKEFKELDGAAAEATSDRESVQTELSSRICNQPWLRRSTSRL